MNGRLEQHPPGPPQKLDLAVLVLFTPRGKLACQEKLVPLEIFRTENVRGRHLESSLVMRVIFHGLW